MTTITKKLKEKRKKDILLCLYFLSTKQLINAASETIKAKTESETIMILILIPILVATIMIIKLNS